MHRSIIAFAAIVAATSAAAFSNAPAEDQPSANSIINGAFAAMVVRASVAAGAPPSALAFMSLGAPAGVLASRPANIPASTEAFALGETPATAAPHPSAVPPIAPSRPTVVITVDRSSQRMTVRVNGVQRWTWAVSTGRRGYATPGGSFRPFRMARDHRSREWDNAPMPYSIFFTQRGHAIHGSPATGRLGSPASHGCVRLSTGNARQLFALVQQHGVSNTSVVITGGERSPVAAARGSRTQPRTRARTQSSHPSAQRIEQPSLDRVASHAPLPGSPLRLAPPGMVRWAQ